jgi:hypothetical protein
MDNDECHDFWKDSLKGNGGGTCLRGYFPIARFMASLSAKFLGSPPILGPIWLVMYAYPIPASGSAKAKEPPAPGSPKELGLPNGYIRFGFRNPSEKHISFFMTSS